MKSDSQYKTHQRDAVLDYLKNASECLKADDILNGLHEKGYNVSKSTVYRTLELFCSEGLVLRYVGDVGQPALYSYASDHSNHFHLKCTECGHTVCVECPFMTSMENHFRSHHGFTVSHTKTMFYGICENCRKKAENKNK